jgi:hypothetical protein
MLRRPRSRRTPLLADRLAAGPWGHLAGEPPRAAGFRAETRAFALDCARFAVFDMTDVERYIADREDRLGADLGYDRAVRAALPPVSRCFAEYTPRPDPESQVVQAGWALAVFGRDDAPELAHESAFAAPQPGRHAATRHVVMGALILGLRDRPGGRSVAVVPPLVRSTLWLDAAGGALSPPTLSMPAWFPDGGGFPWLYDRAQVSLFICMLGFCFFNAPDGEVVARSDARACRVLTRPTDRRIDAGATFADVFRAGPEGE